MIPRHWIIATSVLLALAIAMAAYVWQLRRREAQTPVPAAEEPHVVPPETGPTEKVTVWIANDGTGTLRAQSISLPMASRRQQRAEALMRALVAIYVDKNSPHPLRAGAEVLDVYLVDPGLVVIDLNSAFADGQTSGVLAEELTVASLVQTLSSNIPGLTRAKFLVDGKERDTLAGHVDLTGLFDVSEISDLVKQLGQ